MAQAASIIFHSHNLHGRMQVDKRFAWWYDGGNMLPQVKLENPPSETRFGGAGSWNDREAGT